MANFSASGLSGALTTTLKTALSVRQPASPASIIKMHTIVISSPATPADSAIEWVIQRVSTAGTSTAVTPTDTEDAAQVATAVAGQTFTAEPTAVANTIFFDQAVNQRATYTIVLASGYEWKLGLTATRGMAFSAKHPSATPTVLATGHWRE
jgi:hypothetical protein